MRFYRSKGEGKMKIKQEKLEEFEDDYILRNYKPKTKSGEALLKLREVYLRNGGKK